ncbi:helix-turn-helix transcriptional regulator [Microcoleus sp. B6-A1]|uniref:helix-turn-helix transcriptional regulator n=1 Tax=unclassified Microcoleus TaxID=2642155 RepID=UPI002FD5F864
MIETIANRICEARKLAGLSPAQAAKMLSLPTDRILEIEADTVSVSAQEIEQFAEIFEVSVSWLMGEQLAKVEIGKVHNLTPEDANKLQTILASIRGKQ